MFKKYKEIENSYQSAFLDKIKGHGFWDEAYVVQEKIHGSNLSFWSDDGVTFASAKRSAVLDPDERFYNHQALLKKHSKSFQSIWKALSQKAPALNQLGIFGEVLGGNYPHDDVPKDRSAIQVQSGIFYAPNNVFVAFDIQINGTTYLEHDQITELFKSAGLTFVQSLFEGSLDDCLKYPNAFDSTIYQYFNLPEIPSNVCEGVVIRPKRPLFLNNGGRVILKNKNEIWSEKIKPKRPPREKITLSNQAAMLQAELKSYITSNRLNNVISKIGEVSEKDSGKLMGLLSQDAVKDFKKDHSQAFERLDKKEQKTLTKSIIKDGEAIVKAHFKNNS